MRRRWAFGAMAALALALMVGGAGALLGVWPALGLVGLVLAVSLVVIQRLEARARDRRRSAEERLADRLLAGFPGAVILVDDAGVVEQLNPDFEHHAGYPPGQLLGRRVTTLDVKPLHGDMHHALNFAAARGQPWQGVLACRRADGERCYQDTVVLPLLEEPDGRRRLLLVQRDVTRMRQRYLHDQMLLEQLQGTVSRLPAVIFQARQDTSGRIGFLYLSEELQRLCGLSPEAVLDDADRLLKRVHPEDRDRLTASIAQSAVSLEPWWLEYRLLVPDGVRWLEGRAVPRRRRDGQTFWDGLLIDIGERKQAEQRVQQLVGTDMLTGALNRRAFFEQGEAVLALAERHGRRVPLAMLDLDHFKHLNDTHGHAAGDLALQAFAMSCRDSLRPYDLFARIGGEEFAVILVDSDPDQAWEILERLRLAVEAIELEVDGVMLRFTVSLGLTILEPGGSLDGALSRADRALYRAKREGRNRISAQGPSVTSRGAS
ncbi:sensor domain-containing diguanylate cyclase [Halomonas heilongjiangensis]|uniref:sensor domain-containing diguanylate cyclase n=1 Tax=Halomonas heilongjiangensis TaxID=1387883 RepID=UPI0014739FA6|nr:diguanylate cyclase [Halomonas heilongjiangensis]